MSKQIVIFGGSFNPPGLHHRRIAEALAQQFDEVIVVPGGPRPDKQSSNDVDPIFRATLVSICFAGLPRVEIDLSDLEQAAFSHTAEIDARYASRGDVWHLVGADMVTGGAAGGSFIHKVWHEGPRLWETLRFAVAERAAAADGGGGGRPCRPNTGSLIYPRRSIPARKSATRFSGGSHLPISPRRR